MQRLFLVLFLSLGFAFSAMAQVGRIEGTVKDASGAVLPGVTVTAAGPVSRSERSDAQGTFKFAGLPAGTYSVTAVRPGFAEGRQDGVKVDGEPSPRIDIVLSLVVQETVVVTA